MIIDLVGTCEVGAPLLVYIERERVNSTNNQLESGMYEYSRNIMLSYNFYNLPCNVDKYAQRYIYMLHRYEAMI